MVEIFNSMAMKGNCIKYILLCLLSLVSCMKETPERVAVKSSNTILYSVTASQAPITRVATSGPDFSDGYVFETGDKLYVEHRDGETLKLYGILNLVSGAGTATGGFEGELNCLDGFVPEDNTLLKATLVGAGAADGFFSIANSVVTGVTYPASVPYAALPDLVRKYSYITGTSTYDAKNFNNLTQQSVFLLFSLEVNRTKLDDPMVTTVSVKNNDYQVLAVTDVPVTGLTAVGHIECPGVIPVSKNPDMQSAEVWADNLKCGDPFASDLSLDVNHYYSVKRSSLGTDWFRIKATQNGTNVTFNYTGDGIKYSLDGGENWTDYNTTMAIPLNKDQEICFQGSKTNYKNAKAEGGNTYGAPASKPIFQANKKCFIAGNVMTLLKDRENLSDEAFDGAFSKDGTNNTWLDIDPNDPLLLPATTLTERCYKGMFRRCTALQYAPDLPAEKPAAECYSGMFRQCGNDNLKRVAIFLKVKIGEGNEKNNYPFLSNADHTNLGEGGYLDKWMDGTNPKNGTLYCHPEMNAYWTNFWTWWGSTDKNFFANRPKDWSINNWTTYIQP